MVALAAIAAFIAGLGISEYYNRRIQRIITRQQTMRPTAMPARRPAGLYTPADMDLMRQGYRVGKHADGRRTGDGLK